MSRAWKQAAYAWRQTAETLFLELALKQASLTPNDVEVADVFVKVNQGAQHLFTLDLFAAVDVESASLTIDADARLIVISLRKVVPGDWPHADHKSEDFAATTARREASLARRSEHDAQARLRVLTPTVQRVT